MFSDRIWKRKDDLLTALNTQLAQNLITGRDPQKAIDAIAERFGVEKNAAGRLIMTETAAIQNEARKRCLDDLGVEEFEFVATLDSHTSDMCRSMDGQHFPMSQFEIGINAPPLHCNCRSCTVPYFNDEFTEDETRAARERNDTGYMNIAQNMKYKEWEDEYIDKGSQDSKRDYGFIDPLKRSEKTQRKKVREIIKEMPKKLKLALKGTKIKVSSDETSCYYSDIDVMHLSENPTVDEVWHETGHALEEKIIDKNHLESFKKK